MKFDSVKDLSFSCECDRGFGSGLMISRTVSPYTALTSQHVLFCDRMKLAFAEI